MIQGLVEVLPLSDILWLLGFIVLLCLPAIKSYLVGLMSRWSRKDKRAPWLKDIQDKKQYNIRPVRTGEWSGHYEFFELNDGTWRKFPTTYDGYPMDPSYHKKLQDNKVNQVLRKFKS